MLGRSGVNMARAGICFPQVAAQVSHCQLSRCSGFTDKHTAQEDGRTDLSLHSCTLPSWTLHDV